MSSTTIIYILIIIFANTLGAVSGMGGGIIIKPAMDFINHDSLNNINFFSTVAVLTMSIVSIYRQSHAGIKINKKTSLVLAAGSILGGLLGSEILQAFIKYSSSSKEVSIGQTVITIAVLLIILINSLWPHKNLSIKKPYYYFFSGLFLGTISSGLSIGGGPMNTALLVFLFSTPIKSANLYSLVIIFFSQATNLLTLGLKTHGFHGYKTDLLIYIIPAAIIGGLLGSALAKKLPNRLIQKLFIVMVSGIILLNIYNLSQLI
ncbi:sulfite exporter TauE/SafE family protein [Weissella viridescens]|uniref:Probable membrane transporter protein n=1 Tax=Weissella viridescens TaxID=1629 RepID=A0A3P2RMN6_WEIVI|nr:sulfite exporter TauE/SafE family protein [Weissella viridescens]RRG18788.1 sulfite exporter TauE/SafE family protein [Weissella viridescens]